MELYPLPDFEAIDAKKKEDARRRFEGFARRLGEFLSREARGDEEHPAAIAEKALATGDVKAALGYLSSEVDKAVEQGNKARRDDLMRWKTNLSSNGN